MAHKALIQALLALHNDQITQISIKTKERLSLVENSKNKNNTECETYGLLLGS